jgi:gas vesicle protein
MAMSERVDSKMVDSRMIDSKMIDSKMVIFLVGLGIGSLAGILIAPNSGEETREYLSKKAKEGRDYARSKAQEMKERAEDFVEIGQEAVARKQKQIATAIDAGRAAYEEEKWESQAS